MKRRKSLFLVKREILKIEEMMDKIHDIKKGVYHGTEFTELFSWVLDQDLLNESWLLFIEKRDEVLGLSGPEQDELALLIRQFLDGDLNNNKRLRSRIIKLAKYKLRFDSAYTYCKK